MIELFDRREFEIDRTSSDDTVRVAKDISCPSAIQRNSREFVRDGSSIA